MAFGPQEKNVTMSQDSRKPLADAITASVWLDIEEKPVGQTDPSAQERWPDGARIPDMLGETGAGEVDRNAVEQSPCPDDGVDAVTHAGWLTAPVAQDRRVGDQGRGELALEK